MPFDQAKQIFETEIQKPDIKTEGGAVVETNRIKGHLDEMKSHFDEFIGKMDYRGSQNDKNMYHAALREGIRQMIEDDKTISESEIRPFREGLIERSTRLRQRIIEQQKAFEEIQYQEVFEKVSLDIRAGKFEDAKSKLLTLYRSLSTLNNTQRNGNLNELGLRLDLRIQEQINQVENLAKEYREVFQSGNFINGLQGENYIHGIDSEGNVILSSYSYRAGSRDDWHSASRASALGPYDLGPLQHDLGLLQPTTTSVDQQTGFTEPAAAPATADEEPVRVMQMRFGPRTKLNWMDLKEKIRNENLRIQQFQPHRNSFSGEINDGVDFSVDRDTNVAESEATIAELKQLKIIAHIYSPEYIEKSPEQIRDVLRRAMEEKLNSMGLYFERSNDGIVKPTDIFTKLDYQKKGMVLKNMVEGVDLIIQRMNFEKELETETDPVKKYYLKGEIAFAENRTIDAYGEFFNFINKAEEKQELQPLIQAARSKMRFLSLQLINLAERHAQATIQEEAVRLSEAVRTRTFNEVQELLNKLRQIIQEGRAVDIGNALSMTGPNFLNSRERLKTKSLTKDEVSLRGYHMSFINKLVLASVKENEEERKEELLVIANTSRQQVFRGTAALLYREIMRPEIMKTEKELQKSPDYWERVRALFKRKERIDLADVLNRDQYDFGSSIGPNTNPISTRAFDEANVNQRKDRAREFAAQQAGAAWENLSQTEKDALTARYESDLLDQELQASVETFAFNEYMGRNGRSNPAGIAYADMLNYYDETFKLSDAGVGALKSVISEIAINSVILGVSGGIGNIARAGTLYLARQAIQKAAGTMAGRLSSSILGYAVDIGLSEVVDRCIRSGLLGQNEEATLYSYLTHATSVYGVLRLGSRVTAPMISRLAAQGQFANLAGVIGSGLLVEAPLMTGLNVAFGKTEGRSLLAAYGDSLQTVFAGKIGGKLFNSATGGTLISAERNLEFRAKVVSLKHNQNPAIAAKGRLVEGMIQRGEMPIENMMQIADSNLTAEQISRLRGYMQNPETQAFLITLKYAEESGRVPAEIRGRYNETLRELRECGFSARQARRFARSLTLADLTALHGEGSRNAIDPQLNRAAREQRAEAAKEYLRNNIGNIREALSKPRIKQAFEEFITKWNGDYQQFLANNPRLARIMPADLLRIRFIPVPVVGLMIGIPFNFRSIGQMTEGGLRNFAERLNRHDVVQILNQDGKRQTIEQITMSADSNTLYGFDANQQKNIRMQLVDVYEGHRALIDANREVQELGLRLKRIGLEDVALYITDLNNDASLNDRREHVEIIEKNHATIKDIVKEMRRLGCTQNEIAEIADYSNPKYGIDMSRRIKAGNDAIKRIEDTQKGIDDAVRNEAELINFVDRGGINSTNADSLVSNSEFSNMYKVKITQRIKTRIADILSKFINIQRLPTWIQDHIPVYRAVERKYAGLPDKRGENYWSVGTDNRSYSENFLQSHPDCVLMKSTIGELRKAGDVEIHFEGKKLYLRNFTRLTNFEIIKTNTEGNAPLDMLTRFQKIATETQLRPVNEYSASLDRAVETLNNQPGIARLHNNIPTLIIPDLHGDRNALVEILSKKGPDGRANIELLQTGELQIVVLGDGMHTEQTDARWAAANDEISLNKEKTPAMDAEMVESLATMKMIMDLKAQFPGHFHYLKGNHDNVMNREEGGDRMFGKGEVFISLLATTWLKNNYGEDFLQKWARFEQNLPIMALGNNFLASHAEPGASINRLTLADINNRTPEAVKILTWSRSFSTQSADLMRMAEIDPAQGRYFVGHTDTSMSDGGYQILPDGVTTRVNDSNDFKYVRVEANGSFNHETNILRANAPERRSEVVRPPDISVRDRNQHRDVQRAYVNENLDRIGSRASVQNPRGSIEIILQEDTKIYVHRMSDSDNFAVFNPINGEAKILPENIPIRIGRGYQEGWFPGTVSGHHINIERQGNNIIITNISRFGTHVTETSQ